MEDKVTCKAYRCLQSTIALVKTLMQINESLATSGRFEWDRCEEVKRELQLLEHKLQGYVNSVEILGQRVGATLGLVSVHLLFSLFHEMSGTGDEERRD